MIILRLKWMKIKRKLVLLFYPLFVKTTLKVNVSVYYYFFLIAREKKRNLLRKNKYFQSFR